MTAAKKKKRRKSKSKGKGKGEKKSVVKSEIDKAGEFEKESAEAIAKEIAKDAGKGVSDPFDEAIGRRTEAAESAQPMPELAPVIADELAKGGKILLPPEFPARKGPSDRRKVEAYEEWESGLIQGRLDIMALEEQRSVLSAKLKAAQKALDELMGRGAVFERQGNLLPDGTVDGPIAAGQAVYWNKDGKGPKAQDKGPQALSTDARLVAEYTVKVTNGVMIFSYSCPGCGLLSKLPEKPAASETCECGAVFQVGVRKPMVV